MSIKSAIFLLWYYILAGRQGLGVLISLPIPLPIGTLTRNPQGYCEPLPFPTCALMFLFTVQYARNLTLQYGNILWEATLRTDINRWRLPTTHISDFEREEVKKIWVKPFKSTVKPTKKSNKPALVISEAHRAQVPSMYFVTPHSKLNVSLTFLPIGQQHIPRMNKNLILKKWKLTGHLNEFIRQILPLML